MDKLTEAYNKIKEAKIKRATEAQNKLFDGFKKDNPELFELFSSIEGISFKFIDGWWNQINMEYGGETIVYFQLNLLGTEEWRFQLSTGGNSLSPFKTSIPDEIIIHTYEKILEIRKREVTKSPERFGFDLDTNLMSGNKEESNAGSMTIKCKYCQCKSSLRKSCSYCGFIF